MVPEHSQPPAQINQSLVNGLTCLLRLASTREAVGGRQLARELDLEPTCVNRLLGTMAHLGFAEKTADRKYRPGPAIHVLSAMSMRGSQLLNVALPHLRSLSADAGHAVALGVLWRCHVCYLFHGREEALGKALAGADLFPADKSSIGRILLAQLSGADVLARFAGVPEQGIDRSDMVKGLPRWRQQGYAEGPGDSPSLAVPVGNPPVAAIALVGGRTDCLRHLPHLRETAKAITQLL
ncbi:MAG: helix-turn-helix domain-containing protein [Lentisphaerae bacterium]|jgi:DNA-binding IclR family transcriptional regulator|nr:helix-turn-helix domain-containing protein [Lentisphaerota bacterium]MBT4816642.1 helix-turn-helix domain-containing protein [Lentisphaerota bacterium]MBT5610061.1 helix-turn-helix domain-containing protein [Lentisphaerota bacterium]MBT7055539.1 helix-turn-helix domain-containing protein [Lentisphaerota bacterium]MBT7841506.1 helix-turn-helix domain-containing protein [Lentisphaerota bacterium]